MSQTKFLNPDEEHVSLFEAGERQNPYEISSQNIYEKSAFEMIQEDSEDQSFKMSEPV